MQGVKGEPYIRSDERDTVEEGKCAGKVIKNSGEILRQFLSMYDC